MNQASGEADSEHAESTEAQEAIVLDFLPNGRPNEDRRGFSGKPIGYALGEEEFRLLELRMAEGSKLRIGDRVAFDPAAEGVERIRNVDFEDLSGTAQSEVKYAVEEIVEDDERRFVDFYNDAQAITTRLHALNLLPGIGKKLRNTVLDERKRKPFESFEELEERVSGLHRPREVLVERIMEELREEDLKYRIFARGRS
jgi:putative nucleotide binding protein